MSKRNLLLCFDAFGTLFRPKRPVAQQYAEVARQCGLRGVTDEQVQGAFRGAFKIQAKLHPNYGKTNGMGAAAWWTEVIHETFTPLAALGQALPADLAPRLLHRFSSDEGYTLDPDVPSLLAALKAPPTNAKFEDVVVGVITNSDDRVPGILSSFGLRVSPLRYGTPVERLMAQKDGKYDIDFHCMSYDVGYEKPDSHIFAAAEEMLKEVLGARSDNPSRREDKSANWAKVYVGDDYEKDVVGAINAGWHAVFLGRDGRGPGRGVQVFQEDGNELFSLLEKHRAVQVNTLKTLAVSL